MQRRIKQSFFLRLQIAGSLRLQHSQQIDMMLRQFEDHIGAPLFETTRKSRLTPLGELIHTEAARELSHFDRTLGVIEGLARAQLGNVRLVVTPSVAQVVMPPILRAYIKNHPSVHIDMRDTDSATIQRELLSDRADIGLASLGNVPGFERHLVFSDRFGVICRADHPLACDWSELTWSNLDGVNFIANGLCDQIKDDGFSPVLAASRLHVRNTASILSLVRAGVGVTLLPELSILPEFSDLAFLPLKDTSARREVWMFAPPTQMLTPASRALAQAIRAAKITITHQ